MSKGNEIEPAEGSHEPTPMRRGMQFSLRALLLAPLILVVFIGMAEAVDFHARWAADRRFGFEWTRVSSRWLVDVGVPATLVATYVSLAFLRLPGWVVLAVTATGLGLRRSRQAHFLAWLLALSFPLADTIFDTWLASSGLYPEFNPMRFNTRIVSAFGFVVGMGAWFVGWYIRGRHHAVSLGRKPTWISQSVQCAVLAFVLVISAQGWAYLVMVRRWG